MSNSMAYKIVEESLKLAGLNDFQVNRILMKVRRLVEDEVRRAQS